VSVMEKAYQCQVSYGETNESEQAMMHGNKSKRGQNMGKYRSPEEISIVFSYHTGGPPV